MKIQIIGILIIFSMFFTGCEKMLKEKAFSQLEPDNFLSTRDGIISTLAYSYNRSANMSGNRVYQCTASEELTTEQYYQTGGGDNQPATTLINFLWDIGDPAAAFVYADWDAMWQAIRNTNIVIENVDRVLDESESWREEIKAEARFLRIYSYYKLWNKFGSMVIRTQSDEDLELPRATPEEFNDFITGELREVIKVLKKPGEEPAYGRANKGAAMGLLVLWYLNNRQWKSCADSALSLINSGYYTLVPDYNEMFKLENERNSEFIWIQPAKTDIDDASNAFTAVLFPPGFKETAQDYKFPFKFQEWSNFASQFRLRDDFTNSFDPDDQRQDRILKKYINEEGVEVDLMDGHNDNARGIKFPPDPNAHGQHHGNDYPYIRYAEILLARAEALNNLNGPNQESIDLINMIRNRAGISDYMIGDFNSKESLNDAILKERGHEFWYEGKRRRDLLRMNKFIEYAQARGISTATPRDTLFPLPEQAIEANSKLVQNPGY